MARRSPGSFDTQHPHAPDAIAVGVLQLSRIRSLSGNLSYSVGEEQQRRPPSAVTSLPRPGVVMFLRENGGGFWWTCMYRLPQDTGDWERTINFYRRSERAFPIPGHTSFDPSILMVAGVPADWAHDAFQTTHEDDVHQIVHTYKSAHRGMIMRYSLRTADIADYHPFHQINDRRTVVPDAWFVINDYFNLGPAAGFGDEPLAVDIAAEVGRSLSSSLGHLGVDPRDSAERKVTAITEAVDRVIMATEPPPAERIEELAIGMGCLWGQCLCDDLGLEWCRVIGGEESHIAVVSPDRSQFVRPMTYMLRQLKQRKPSADNTVLLLFNMLKAGSFDTKGRRAYQQVG